jgi:hypothetical protein
MDTDPHSHNSTQSGLPARRREEVSIPALEPDRRPGDDLPAAALQEALGVTDQELQDRSLNEWQHWLGFQKGMSDREKRIALSAAHHKAEAYAPRDPTERALVRMMISTEEAIERAMARSLEPSPAGHAARTQVLKLMAMFLKLSERFDKHRRGGKQSMTVEHLHIEAGAQANVGNFDVAGHRKNDITD